MSHETEGARSTYGDALAAMPVSRNIQAVVGVTTTVLLNPDPTQYRTLALQVEVGDFRVAPGHQAPSTFVDADVNVAENRIAKVAHGFTDVEGPLPLSNSGGALPAGLSAQDYWLVKRDADSYGICATQDNANKVRGLLKQGIAWTGAALQALLVDITAAAGGGTHSWNAASAVMIAATGTSNQALHAKGSLLLKVSAELKPLFFSAPTRLTVKGSTAGSILNYWWLRN